MITGNYCSRRRRWAQGSRGDAWFHAPRSPGPAVSRVLSIIAPRLLPRCSFKLLHSRVCRQFSGRGQGRCKTCQDPGGKVHFPVFQVAPCYYGHQAICPQSSKHMGCPSDWTRLIVKFRKAALPGRNLQEFDQVGPTALILLVSHLRVRQFSAGRRSAPSRKPCCMSTPQAGLTTGDHSSNHNFGRRSGTLIN